MKKVDKIVDKANYTDLKHYYMDACSDKEFSDFVHKLPIEENFAGSFIGDIKNFGFIIF